MAVLQIDVYSKALDMEVHVNVLYPEFTRVPEAAKGDIPVLYLLHGMGGNAHTWLHRTAIQRLVRKTNLIVVMPDTHNGWYTNTRYGYPYFDAIAQELPKLMQQIFPAMSKKREKTFIAGLSMGGYGAFKIALSTNQYSYAASLSGALNFDGFDAQAVELGNPDYWSSTFGDMSDWPRHPESIQQLAKTSDKKLHLFIWCGKEDFLIEANRSARDFLEAEGYQITYKENHGKHEWYYWDRLMESVLEWLPIDFELEERLS